MLGYAYNTFIVVVRKGFGDINLYLVDDLGVNDDSCAGFGGSKLRRVLGDVEMGGHADHIKYKLL